MIQDIPAPGFIKTRGDRTPPDDGTLYHIQLRNGFCDMANKWKSGQLIWIHDFSIKPEGSGGDIVAVRPIK
jgi:hypothetical protein